MKLQFMFLNDTVIMKDFKFKCKECIKYPTLIKLFVIMYPITYNKYEF